MGNPFKLTKEQENPIDYKIYSIVDKIIPYFYKLGFTPNMITTLSFVSALISLYLLYNDSYIYSGIFWGMNYIFDCMDGFMARKYDMVSKFGDIYDHVTDWTSGLMLIYLMYYKKKYDLLVLIIIFGILMTIHVGCQERVYNNKNTTTISILKELCPNEKYIYYTRYFGCATENIVIVLAIMSNHFK